MLDFQSGYEGSIPSICSKIVIMKTTKTTNEDMQRLYDYMDKMGISYTIDRNPSEEKIARIKAQIEKNKIILKLPQ
jgi:hypothetical protein